MDVLYVSYSSSFAAKKPIVLINCFVARVLVVAYLDDTPERFKGAGIIKKLGLRENVPWSAVRVETMLPKLPRARPTGDGKEIVTRTHVFSRVLCSDAIVTFIWRKMCYLSWRIKEI